MVDPKLHYFGLFHEGCLHKIGKNLALPPCVHWESVRMKFVPVLAIIKDFFDSPQLLGFTAKLPCII